MNLIIEYFMKYFLLPNAMSSSYFCPPAKFCLIAYELKNK